MDMLNTRYFHVVFTLPPGLNALAYANQQEVYSLFFKAAPQSLLQLAMDSKRLGAKPGLTGMLHTWGQNLPCHPHIHFIVTGGGLANGSERVPSRKKLFVPVRALSKLFRGKFLAMLAAAGLGIPGHFESLVSSLYKKDWVVYCRPPFEDAGKVVQYLARYTHRVAISNNRILSLSDGIVAFNWRGYRDGGKTKAMRLGAVESVRRFLMRTLPPGFRKIRHYGILAPRGKQERLAICRKATCTPEPAPPRAALEILQGIFGGKLNACPACKTGQMSRASPLPANRIAC